MTKDEALKLALETLESSRVFVMSREMIKKPEGADWYDSRITAIKEALAQPVQEQALLDAIVGGTGVMLGDKRIDPSSIYKQPEQEPVARVIDNGTPEGATEWIPFTNRVEPLKTGDLLYTHAEERNFCPRCGKHTADLTTIHTCTPPQEKNI
jgi:hypothetical protein